MPVRLGNQPEKALSTHFQHEVARRLPRTIAIKRYQQQQWQWRSCYTQQEGYILAATTEEGDRAAAAAAEVQKIIINCLSRGGWWDSETKAVRIVNGWPFGLPSSSPTDWVGGRLAERVSL